MNKEIPAVLLLNEPIPLLLVEPFHCTLCQSTNLLTFLSFLSNSPGPRFGRGPSSQSDAAEERNSLAPHDLAQYLDPLTSSHAISQGEIWYVLVVHEMSGRYAKGLPQGAGPLDRANPGEPSCTQGETQDQIDYRTHHLSQKPDIFTHQRHWMSFSLTKESGFVRFHLSLKKVRLPLGKIHW